MHPSECEQDRTGAPLRILILGGTGFIGPFQVRYALGRGHAVTLFNRGRTNAGLFPDVETLIGDRNGQLDALRGQRWDVVIDNSRANPDWVRMSAEFLKDSVDRYFYVSSRSAYENTSRIPMTAAAPTFTYETAGVARDAERLPYGLAKALSEREAQRIFVGRTNIVRPGLIIGPEDETDRFTYWPVRIHRGGEVLAPGDPSDTVQIIDVRDLTEWMIRMAETGHVGVFNGVGPATPRPIGELLYGIRAVTTAETTFTWVNYDFLREIGVRPYSDMPVWMHSHRGARRLCPLRPHTGGGGRPHLPTLGGHGQGHTRLPFLSAPGTSASPPGRHFGRAGVGGFGRLARQEVIGHGGVTRCNSD